MPKSDLLARILETPRLALVVPRLPPEVLHKVIQNCGLEDCGDIVALATPAQLMRVFDLDLWHGARPGLDEQLDADRFGVWLEVLIESGVEVAADKLLGIDVDLVIAALAQHLRVFDRAAVSKSGHEIATYVVEPLRTGSWDAIVQLLVHLDAEHHDFFNQVMSGCRSVSNAGHEIDGLDSLLADREQALFDLASEREQRRERAGFVVAADARAFLQMARRFQPAADPATTRNPMATAYFRALNATAPADVPELDSPDESDGPDQSDEAAAATAMMMDVLVVAGVLAQPRALLAGGHDRAPRLALIQSHMQVACDRDGAAFSARTAEFAYLANTMMAGCSVQSRALTPREASDAAAAVCNLGLENWPHAGAASIPEDFLVDHDLVCVFQAGWTMLHRDVCLYTAKQLIAIVAELRCADQEIQSGLDALRLDLTRHLRDGVPWQAREALDVIMILDMPAWAALLGLIEECPVLHAGLGASKGTRTRTVSASDFEFISENGQIASVHRFLQSLPATLRG